MAAEQFWQNLRIAASLYSPSVATDNSDVNPTNAKRVAKNATAWLTPKSVAGFDRNDFTFLDERDQNELAEAVDSFTAVAAQVPANKPPTAAQAAAAEKAFATITRILEPNKYWDYESFRVQRILTHELTHLPAWVTGIWCDTGLDHTGDPAIWIWVVVTDKAADDGSIVKYGHGIIEEIRSKYQQISQDRWPFVRFCNPSESVGNRAR